VSYILLSKHVILNPRLQARKRLISYYKTNGMIFFLKHFNADHIFIANLKKKKKLFTERKRRKTTKKKTIMSSGSISSFFWLKIP